MNKQLLIAASFTLVLAACGSDADPGGLAVTDAGPDSTAEATSDAITSAPDTSSDTDSGLDPDGGPNVDTGADTDVSDDTDPGPEPDADSDTDTSTDTSTDTGLDLDSGTTGDGLQSLYIGHSFGRVFADRTVEYAPLLGIEGHAQQSVWSGGQSGAPQDLWDSADKRAEVMAILETGEIEHMTMICCSEQFLVTGTDPAINDWMTAALEYNPDTRFALALPWPDFPADWPQVEEVIELWDEAHAMWMSLISELRTEYPGVEIVNIPHGRAAVALRQLFDEGRLRDVSQLIGPVGESVFTDAKGHAGERLREIGTLVWLGAIYGVDVSRFPHSRETNIARIAQMILDAYVD